MKKFRSVLLLILALVCSLALFVACDNGSTDDGGNGGNGGTQQQQPEEKPDDEPENTKKDITGVTFGNKTVVYDGTEYVLTVEGTLPEGVSVSYTNNKGTNAGTYNAEATLTGEDYNTLTLKATLTIEKATITGITFEGDTVTYNGEVHSLAIEGTLPEGVDLTYTNNGKTDAGTYEVTATVSGTNYNTLTLKATLIIEKATITGITMEGDTLIYDGEVHSLAIEGTLPEGVDLTYTNNGKTDAGTYEVTATVSGTNYNTLTLKATLTIEKATITGITFEGDTVTYNGEVHSLAVEGEVPDGVTVSYENNDQTEAGSYTVKAILSGKNYVTLELEAVLRILPDLSTLAQSIISAFGSTPDVWEFLPDSFRLSEDRAYKGNPAIDFTNSVSVSNIPVTGIGKQLDVIYGTVVNMQDLLGYVNTFYGAANTIASLYQQYINANPDNYREFEGQTSGGGIGFRIELTETEYLLLAKMGPASLELTANVEEESYTGRVQISDSNALKFEVGENSLTIALNILNHAVTELIFVRENDIVVGHLYESLGASVAGKDLAFTTSALLIWDGDYVSVAGANGDFFLGASGQVVELYDANTGKYLGSKVKETLSSIVYNTYWFNLNEFGGINSVRTDANGKFYLNGSSSAFENKKVGGLSLKTASRRYDIEMKTVYFYTYDAATQKFDKVGMEIPMLFVQAEMRDTLAADVHEKNSSLNITDKVSDDVIERLDFYYVWALATYEEIAQLVTPADIIAYVGTKNSWFN